MNHTRASRVWVRAPKPERRKHVYISVRIFCRRAEYDSAEKTIAPKILPLYFTNYYPKIKNFESNKAVSNEPPKCQYIIYLIKWP